MTVTTAGASLPARHGRPAELRPVRQQRGEHVVTRQFDPVTELCRPGGVLRRSDATLRWYSLVWPGPAIQWETTQRPTGETIAGIPAIQANISI